MDELIGLERILLRHSKFMGLQSYACVFVYVNGKQTYHHFFEQKTADMFMQLIKSEISNKVIVDEEWLVGM